MQLNISIDHSLLSLGLGFFVSGFLGSWHCAAMCGPISCFMGTKKQLWPYQIGRGMAYILVGGLSGGFFEFITSEGVTSKMTTSSILRSYFQSKKNSWIHFFFLGLLSFLLIFFSFSSQGTKLPIWVSKIYLKFPRSGIWMGILTPLMPCGWLYSFILSSMTSRSFIGGAAVMGIFWISTLPALSAASLFMKNLIQRSDSRQQKIARIILLLASLYSLWSFFRIH